jgi:hypothetical protein
MTTTRPAASTTPTHHWFGDHTTLPFHAPAAEVRQLVRTELSGIGLARQSVYAASPIVIPRASYAELHRATALVLDLLRRVMLEAGATTDERLTAYGVPDGAYPLFQRDAEVDEAYATAVCRPDIVIGANGPQFVEFNVAAAAGGVVELHCLLRAWTALTRRETQPFYWWHDPFDASGRLIDDVCDEWALPRDIAVVGSRRDISPDAAPRYFDLWVEHLQRRGLTAELVDPEHNPDDLPRHQLGLRHFTVYEWAKHDVDLTPVQQAVDDGLLLVTTQTAAFLDNKKTMAMLSEGRPWMTQAERETVARYLPWTRVLTDRPTTREGRRIDLVPHVLDHQEDFIIKPGIGMQGMGVVLGRQTDPSTWRHLVQDAADRGDSIVQRYIEPRTCPVDVTWDDGGEIARVQVAPVLSPFLYGGHWGGVFARFVADDPHRGVVSQDTGGAQQNAVVAR